MIEMELDPKIPEQPGKRRAAVEERAGRRFAAMDVMNFPQRAYQLCVEAEMQKDQIDRLERQRLPMPTPAYERCRTFLDAVMDELRSAYAKHGIGQWGRHEFYAVLKEEVDEVWQDIKTDAPQEKLMKEIVQVAAMCLRYAETGDRYREPAPGICQGCGRSGMATDDRPAFLRKIMD